MRWLRACPAHAALLRLTAVLVAGGAVVSELDPAALVNTADWLAGGLALSAGLATMLLLLRNQVSGARPQLVLAAAMSVWGSGGLLRALAVGWGTSGDVAAAELVQVLALPLVFAVVAALPGSTALLRIASRVALDAVALGVAASLAFVALFHPNQPGPGETIPLGALLPASLIVTFGAALGLLRRSPRGLRLLLQGLLTFGLGSVWVLLTRVGMFANASHVVAELMVVAGCGVSGAGLLAVSRSRLPAAHPGLALRGERRDLVLHAFVTAAALAMIAVGLAAHSVRGMRVSEISMSLGIAALLALAVREVAVMFLRRQLVRKVMAGAHTDPLTGLVNRIGLTDLLDGGRATQGTLVVLDIDGFAHANQVLGPSGADGLLVGVARALRSVVVPRGTVLSRIGGDEFAAWLPGPDEQLATARDLVAAVSASNYREGAEALPVTTSAGVARTGVVGYVAAGDGVEAAGADVMLRRASSALLKAKRNGPASVAEFDAELNAALRRRASIEQRLAALLDGQANGSQHPEGWFALHMQPVVDLTTGRVCSVEALARWFDPELGQVSPEEFVTIAEQTGLILPLGHRVLGLAVEALAELSTTRPDLSVAINVSAAQLRGRPGGRGFTADVRRALAEHGVPGERLVVEVTESLLISKDDPAVAELKQLVDLGIRIAVDDFGSGYWALGYLQWLPAHILKIDRALVLDLGSDPRSDAIVRAIIGLATDLGMAVVVEGVETREIAHRARELGAGLAQGWHFSKAVPLAGLAAATAQIEAMASSDAAEPHVVTEALPEVGPQPSEPVARPAALPWQRRGPQRRAAVDS